MERVAKTIAGKARSIADYWKNWSITGLSKRWDCGVDLFESVEIETITFCNRRCSYCPNSVFQRGLFENTMYMPEDIFKKIIHDLMTIGFRGRISPHFYGEPLLDKRLPDLMRYVSENLPGAKIDIFTNGDFLDGEYYRRLVSAGVKQFTITQHGEEMPRAVREMFEYRKGGGEDGVKVVYRSYTSDSELDNRGGLIEHKTYIKRDVCYNPSRELVINYKGEVILCCNDYFGSIAFGNVKEKSVMQIWKEKKMVELRKSLRKGEFALEICRKCVGMVEG